MTEQVPDLAKGVYELPEKEEALQVVHELHAFTSSHYWLTTVTLESAHRKEVTQWMKLFLGDKLKVRLCGCYSRKSHERDLWYLLKELKSNDLVSSAVAEQHEIKDTRRHCVG